MDFKVLGRPYDEKTTAVIRLVMSDYKILLEQHFHWKDPIYSAILNRPELKKYKRKLSAEKIRVLIAVHKNRLRAKCKQLFIKKKL